jgi:hypothetical protein
MFLLIIRLYLLKLFSTREYICIWSRTLGCGCERYPDFQVKEDEYWHGGSLLSKPRNKCYLCIGWCLFGRDMKLNPMISHRLADDYVMVDSFNFGYDLLQSFCLVCKNFLLASFMNESEVFSFKKEKEKEKGYESSFILLK